MPRMLSQGLRERIVAAVDGGTSRRAATAQFVVNAFSAIRWRQWIVQHGTPAAKPQSGDRRAARIDAHATFSLGALEAKDDVTLIELQALLAKRGTAVGIGTGSRAKKMPHATQQDCPDALKRREEWSDRQLDLDPERLVFLDET